MCWIAWRPDKVHAWQAAAEGDAQKADKRRKKKKKEEEVDNIFGNSDSDDGGDYVPGAEPEEAEYQDDDAAGADEEPDNDTMEQDRRVLKGTGERPALLTATLYVLLPGTLQH